MSVSKQFILAGDAIFTIETPKGTHATFRVQHVEANERWAASWFVKLLTGPDNTSDYTYLGKLDDFTGQVKLTAKSCCGPDAFSFKLLNRVLARIWADDHAAYESSGFKTYHEGRCGRCGRALTVPSSVESGFGPECSEILGLASVKGKRAKAVKKEQPVETHFASDMHYENPEAEDVTDRQPVYDSEGELVWWNGIRNGKPVRIFND